MTASTPLPPAGPVSEGHSWLIDETVELVGAGCAHGQVG